VQRTKKKVNSWLKVNKLSLNVSKTNYMIFSGKLSQTKLNIIFDNNLLDKVECTKFLGVHIDSQLTWNNHIKYIHAKISKSMYVLYRAKLFFTKDSLYSIYCTLILPYLMYCCEIWGNNYKQRLQCLYVLQKRAIRIVGNVGYRDHSAPVFCMLSTLHIFDIVKYRSAVTMYMAYSNLLPLKIQSYFTFVLNTHNHSTRNNCNFTVKYRKTHLKSLSLSNAGVEIWNNLDPIIKQSINLKTFKINYKKNLLNMYL
jgi:hypothetical protein